VEDELPLGPVPIDELIAKHDAWLAVEYHARKHDTTGRVPREHWLEQVDHLRPLPPGKSLDEVFLHRVQRDVRKDGTVRFEGRLLEVRAELAGERGVELRFDPSRLDGAGVLALPPGMLRPPGERSKEERIPGGTPSY